MTEGMTNGTNENLMLFAYPIEDISVMPTWQLRRFARRGRLPGFRASSMQFGVTA
jgi:hypothetical protein